MIIKLRNDELKPKWFATEMGLLIGIFGLCVVMMILMIKTSLFSEKIGVAMGNVYVNGTTSVAYIDEDFVCATLDWWPPQKCDYGTCSWGDSSLLNLVSNFFVSFFTFHCSLVYGYCFILLYYQIKYFHH